MTTSPLTNPVYIYSRLSGETLTSLILRQYDIPSPVRCEFFTLGLHDNYLVYAGADRYLLRVYRTDLRSNEEIQFELDLLTFLRKQGLPVSFPLVNRAGEYSQVLEAAEGTRHVALFSIAKGKAADKSFNEKLSYQLGKTVAELHHASERFECHHQRPHLSLEYLLDDSLVLLSGFLQHRPEDLAFLARVRSDAVAVLGGLSTSAPAYGICIGDVHPWNAHFTDAGEITLFDFDQCGFGWRAFEIGKFLAIARIRGIRPDVVRAFVFGYETIRTLDAPERDAIPHFVQVAHVWMLGIYARNVDLVGRMRLSDEFFTERLNFTKAVDVNRITDSSA